MVIYRREIITGKTPQSETKMKYPTVFDQNIVKFWGIFLGIKIVDKEVKRVRVKKARKDKNTLSFSILE